MIVRLSALLLLLSKTNAFISRPQLQPKMAFRKTESLKRSVELHSTSTEDETETATQKELWAVERVSRMTDWLGHDLVEKYPNPLSLKPNVRPAWFVESGEAVAARVEVRNNQVSSVQSTGAKNAAAAFTLAGPRKEIMFDPKGVKAALVTCGGLCPGLNTVLRELVMCLRRQYGVEEVFGVPGGYRGFLSPENWISLDEEAVAEIHNKGGSILGTSRGGHDTEKLVDALEEMGINQLYVTGGDGTVRGAIKIADEVEKRRLPIAVAVVPKTIDNDLILVDRTFGFETAVEAAREAIDAAHVEADGFPNGLGLVKLMGRRSGFIAMHVTLGARNVDLCLVPEVPFYLDGEGGIVDFLYERMLKNGKAIIACAEGAGQDLMKAANAVGDEVKDASGNVLLDDIGPWLMGVLKEKLDAKLEGVSQDKVSPKYIDPSYMLRGIPPNTSDNVYCTQLAHQAVHGAFAGYSNFLIGSVNTRPCYVPLRLVADKRNVVDVAHRSLWEQVVFDTGQPAFQVNEDFCDVTDIDLTTASGGCISPD